MRATASPLSHPSGKEALETVRPLFRCTEEMFSLATDISALPPKTSKRIFERQQFPAIPGLISAGPLARRRPPQESFSCQIFTIYHDNVNFSTVGGMSSFAFISKVAEASHRSSAEPSKAERLGHSTGRKLSDSAFRAEKGR